MPCCCIIIIIIISWCLTHTCHHWGTVVCDCSVELSYARSAPTGHSQHAVLNPMMLRYRRRQMVQLQQLDGKLVWVNLQELCSNSKCLLLAHNPSKLPVVKCTKHLDGNGIARQQLLVVESPEPCQLLVCLSVGPHQVTPPPTQSRKQVCMANQAILLHAALQVRQLLSTAFRCL